MTHREHHASRPVYLIFDIQLFELNIAAMTKVILLMLLLFEAHSFTISSAHESRVLAKNIIDLYNSIGISATVDFFPLARAQALAQSGRYDAYLVGAKLLEAEFDQLVRVPIPMGLISIVSCTKRGNFSNRAHSWHEINKFRIGHVRGSLYIKAKTKGSQVTVSESDLTVLRLLSAGRVDFAIVHALAGARSVNIHGLEKKIICLDPPLDRVAVYHYVHKKHKNLIPLLATAITKHKNMIVDEAWTMP